MQEIYNQPAQNNAEDYALAGQLSLRDAPRVAEELKQALVAGRNIRVRTGDVEAMDLSIVQLLVASIKTAEASGCAIAIEAPEGGVLDQVLKRAGLDQPLDGCLQRRDGFWIGLSCQASKEEGYAQ
ncbi:STAS domain-containing protein [Consotaella salsifontis]|uniref:ABC-type transporter Mla maintaining outer membrane lipid asymmetry, MlaB component, contains STAS domain n=1 Tax=Consotaella salsifontis TaxID=1365950 RepID=A0A1T4QVU5_9HYPH|nr:STAS domain-containing protein [Consotaella salsifontis]SKA07438.1 ABC-type transporter Mla maintaining outer membrane lipid asymmetry, MlaB component, contains STAS domain [Consotaella salsifontis]